MNKQEMDFSHSTSTYNQLLKYDAILQKTLFGPMIDKIAQKVKQLKTSRLDIPPKGVCLCDVDGQIIIVNQPAQKVLNYQKTVEGKNFFDYLPSNELAKFAHIGFDEPITIIMSIMNEQVVPMKDEKENLKIFQVKSVNSEVVLHAKVIQAEFRYFFMNFKDKGPRKMLLIEFIEYKG